jgi:amino acid/peptide transporter (Peptide:H+ symporter), bacterial
MIPSDRADTHESEATLWGHPRGLTTLFFTEMWERFSFYGMRALLILFMTAAVQNGGLGFTTADAGVIYGLYTAMVYMTALPGGWLADRFLGQRRAVLYGGIIIALGHFTMAFPGLAPFYAGLCLIVLGTGLLKPNISVIVGQLYGPADTRRDAGFSIFYMGINLGAFLSPLACGYVGQKINWHWGFGLSGIGMTIGVIQYVLGGSTSAPLVS